MLVFAWQQPDLPRIVLDASRTAITDLQRLGHLANHISMLEVLVSLHILAHAYATYRRARA
jgi:hypothetical protein